MVLKLPHLPSMQFIRRFTPMAPFPPPFILPVEAVRILPMVFRTPFTVMLWNCVVPNKNHMASCSLLIKLFHKVKNSLLEWNL